MAALKFGHAFLLCMGVVALLSKAVISGDSDSGQWADLMGFGDDSDYDSRFDISDDPDDESRFDISDAKNVLFDGKTSNENANTLQFRQPTACPNTPVNRICCSHIGNSYCLDCIATTNVSVCGTCTGGMSCGSCRADATQNCVIYCQCCCSNGLDGSCKPCDCGTPGCSLFPSPTPTVLSTECQAIQTCQCFRHAGICQASCNPPLPDPVPF